MDLKSGYPWWAIKNGLLHAFPALREELRCEVAVIGSGITGAIIADELSRAGHQVVVLEQRDVGWGSTAASTALLQYEIDTPMTELAELHGERDALLAYRGCLDAIELLRARAERAGACGFAPAHSLYYASRAHDERALRAEFELRARHGFPVRWLTAEEVARRYGFAAPCAILSEMAARVDPYRLAYQLLIALEARGGRVYDRSPVEKIEASEGGVTLQLGCGARVSARHLVMAAGYANQLWLDDKVAKNRSSYAFITDPIDRALLGPLQDTMLWESARPYLYLRATEEGRLLIGGEDDAVDIPAKRDARVLDKAERLMKQVNELFPHLPLTPAFAWAGTFAETEDGLPYCGTHPQYGPRVHFAMAYGGNGIVYSELSAGIIRAAIEQQSAPLSELFSFRRLER